MSNQAPQTTLERYPILRFFTYQHLPEPLQEVSRRFYNLAYDVADIKTNHPAETAVALRKLLEAKDAAVRASLP